MTTLAKTAIDQQIEELGAWAAGLELSAADPEIPYWMRQQDAARAKLIRELQAKLLADCNLALHGLQPCRTIGCTTLVLGSEYCPRCEEEINGEPYPLANVLRGETFVQYVSRLWKRITAKEA